MKKDATILIVEDSLISAEYLRGRLEDEGYTVIAVVDTGQEAVEMAHQYKPNIILMDIMLKDSLSGTEAAVQIHRDNPVCKIIFLTAYAEKEMLDYADESQAYAYLLKPYREQEILATIRLALSQDKKRESSTHIIKLSDGYYFHIKLHRLCKDKQEVMLSKNAHKFIEILVKNRNSTVSNEQIGYYIWNECKSDNTLRSLLHRIREKTNDNLIQNVKGMGYCICTTLEK